MNDVFLTQRYLEIVGAFQAVLLNKDIDSLDKLAFVDMVKNLVTEPKGEVES